MAVTHACVTATVVDGLVLSRSAFHHSVNYRCAVVFGGFTEVCEPDAKRRALDAIVEHLVPGRTAECRPPTEKELRATLVLCMRIEEASAKVRSGGPNEEGEDLEGPHWGGHLPLALLPCADAVADSVHPPPCEAPPSVRSWGGPAAVP